MEREAHHHEPEHHAVELVIRGRSVHISDIAGLEIRRILPYVLRRHVGPFVFLDHMGPSTIAAGNGMDVRPHPHIGLSTVTYLFDGAIGHKDSLGVDQVIRPGDVNWMTAGRGIVHSERTPGPERERGHRVHGMQAWVALPVEHEETDPAFHHHPGSTLPEFENGGAPVRLIAGSFAGHTAQVKVFSSLFYLDVRISPGGSYRFDPADLSTPATDETAVYIAQAEDALQLEGLDAGVGDLCVLKRNVSCEIYNPGTAEAHCMLLGGAAFPEKRTIYWNFVSSSKERIEQAKDDWRTESHSAFPPVPGDAERIPLPDETGRQKS